MPPSIRKGILILLLIAILSIALAFIPNMLSDGLSAWCKERWGENYKYFLVAVLPFCAVVLVLLTTDLGKYFLLSAGEKSTDRFNIPPGPKSRHILDHAKAAIANAEPGEALRFLSELKLPSLGTEIDLLSSRLVDYQRTRRHGVESRDTENRTFNRITRDTRDLITTLEKELAASTENFDTICNYLKKRYNNRLGQKLAKRQPVNLRRIPSTEGTSEERASTFVAYNSEEIGGTMAQIFHEGRGRLLLLGSPGAGKTTLMIQLVLELIDSEQDSMPVLLNLATWSKDFITLEAWLKKILPAELGVNDRLASEIILRNRLILLLDGFDEVKEDERESCIEAIKRYSEDNTRQYAISSRIEEYKQITKDAPVESQIEVGPLSLDQLQKELERLWSDPVSPERGARLLWNAIQENELLQKVVETPFYFNSLQILFSGSNTWAELQIKADSVREMQDQITARFVQYELDGAREEYPAEKSSHWLSFLASRMNQRNMVVFELLDLQYDWWSFNWWVNIQSYLIAALNTGLSGGLIMTFVISAMSDPGIGVAAGLYFALFISLLIITERIVERSTVSIYTTDGESESVRKSWKRFIQSTPKEKKDALKFSMAVSIPIGLFSILFVDLLGGLFIGLFITLGSIISSFEERSEIIQITSPHQRFNASIKNGLLFSILLHKHLCYILFKNGLFAPNVVAFLNELSRRHILEFDGDPFTGTGGGSWRFRHRILQEYFAEKWVKPEHENKK